MKILSGIKFCFKLHSMKLQNLLVNTNNSHYYRYGYVLIVPISIFMLSLIVDIAISWKQAKNKAMHITMYISSLFILVRYETSKSGTRQSWVGSDELIKVHLKS